MKLQLFELLTASFYLKNGYEVAFIPENSIAWPDGETKKSPDLLVKSGDLEFYVECKRADKQNQALKERRAGMGEISAELSQHMHEVAPWNIITGFHEQVADVTPEEVIRINLVTRGKTGSKGGFSISVAIRAIDKIGLKRHYRKQSVRPNSPQHELLVFGDIDSNENAASRLSQRCRFAWEQRTTFSTCL